MFRAGYACRKITPLKNLELAGVGGPPRPGEPGSHDLFVKVVILDDQTQQLILLSFDLMYVSRPLRQELETWLHQKFGLPPDALFCTATHTHGAPLSLDVYFDNPTLDVAYLDKVTSESRVAILEAMEKLYDATLFHGSNNCQLSINRRRFVPDRSALKRGKIIWKLLNRPNPNGIVDNVLSVISIRFAAKGVKEILILSTGCHPSILRNNIISPDFPGYIEEKLKKAGKDCHVVFLQGFSGNTRASIVENIPFSLRSPGAVFDYLFDRKRFRKNSDEADVCEVSGKISESVKATKFTQVFSPSLSASSTKAELELEQLPVKSYFGNLADNPSENQSRRRYARYVADHYDDLATIDISINLWRLGKGISLMGFEGEMFAEYAHWLRNVGLDKGDMLVPVSCAHGMRGYIPTASSLAEGGYEVDRSRPIFGIPARFKSSIEANIKSASTELLSRLQ